MNDANFENVLGALAFAIADDITTTTQPATPANIPSAAIALIGHVPGITIIELSEGLGLSHPGTVRLVDRMTTAGLVERRKSQSDGRAVELHLTKAGASTEQTILNRRGKLLQQAASVLSAAERRTMAQIAQKMLSSMLRGESHALSICRLCNSQACTNCPVDTELDKRSNHEGKN